MIVTIHQPQYLPYLGFFHKVRHADMLVLLDDAQFQKQSFQNRNTIKTDRGPQWLTIPILHHFGQQISHVEIGQTTNWRKKHWAAIQTNYGPAPHFDRFGAELRDLLTQRSDTKLLAVDVDLLRWAMHRLDIQVPVKLSSELGAAGASTSRLVEICRIVGADAYLSGPGGRDYMDMGLFEAAGIRVEFQAYTAKPYPQLFPSVGFVPNLAVVDALFNLGDEARDLIA
jgi:hypothetical protein